MKARSCFAAAVIFVPAFAIFCDVAEARAQGQPAGGAQAQPARQIPPAILRQFDADQDGKLSPTEQAKLRAEMQRRRGATAGNRPPMQQPIPENVTAYRDVSYGPHETRNLYDLYVPKPKSDGKDARPAPIVIWVHGGGWQNGNKGGGPALALLQQGFAVATINYRLSGDAIFPAQIHDCKAAVRHLRAKAKEYRIDPERFGVWGSSAGGHLVALLGTSGDVKDLEGAVGDFTSVSSRVQAVCDFYGPTDLLQMGGRHNDGQSPESKLIGGPIQENKEKVARANPITYVSADDPPFLIMHGDQDMVVPYGQSELLLDALEKAKVPAQLVKIEGAGHGGPGFSEADKLLQITEFFQKELK